MNLLNKKHIIFAVAGIIFFSSCSHDEVPCYEKGADGVYFLDDSQSGKLSKSINFATLADVPDEAVVDVKLKLLGNLLNDDTKRVILKTRAVDDYPEAVTSIPEISFGAGEYEKSFQISVQKPAEMNKVYAVTLYIDKAGLDNIGVGIDDREAFTLYVEFSLNKPRNWEWGANIYFGEWSAEKHIFLVKLSGNPDFAQSYDYAGLHMQAVSALREIIKNTPDQAPDFDLPFVDYNTSFKTYKEIPDYWNELASKYLGNYDPFMFGGICQIFSATVKTEKKIFAVGEDGLKDLNRKAVEYMLNTYDDLFNRGNSGSSYTYVFWVPMIEGLSYQLQQPACWQDAGCGAMIERYYGKYSESKYKFMIDTWLSYQNKMGEKFVTVQMFPVYNEFDKESGAKYSVWDESIGGEDAIKNCYNIFKAEYDKNPSAYDFSFPDIK